MIELTIKERIKNIMMSVFDLSISDLNNNSSPETIENWDSLRHMNLVVALEEEFNIEFEDDEIGVLLDFSTIVSVVQNKAKLKH
tara:strand:- start:482 stop:733 length:252 start_codon:yes stop_codon:yes gene_type:complete